MKLLSFILGLVVATMFFMWAELFVFTRYDDSSTGYFKISERIDVPILTAVKNWYCGKNIGWIVIKAEKEDSIASFSMGCYAFPNY